MRTMELRVVGASALALALAAAGCGSSGSCESSTICGNGEVCYAGRCVSSLPPGLCTPPTNPAPTYAGTTGPTSVPACSTPAPAGTVLPTSWLAQLTVKGALQAAPPAHVVANVGDEVTFNVPPGTAAVTVHSQATAAAATFNYQGYPIPNSVVPTNVCAPNGYVLYDDMADSPHSPGRAEGYYGGVTEWTGSFGLPDTWRLTDLALSRGELPSGTWKLQVNDWNAECAAMTASGCTRGTPATGSYDLTVVTRPGPFRSTGSLDLALYIIGGGGGAAAKASDPAYLRFVQGIGQLLGRAGICLGAVRFYDLDPAVRGSFATVDICGNAPCGQLSQLFSFAAPVDGVHLFIVDYLDASRCSSGTTGTIVGMDGSIPGPSGLPGARTSGAVMTVADIALSAGTRVCTGSSFNADFTNCPADRAAYIASHEIGHWLGLYHTTEHAGTLFDPLPDTAECPSTCGTCMPGAVCASNCVAGNECGGGDNLMFWLLQPPYSKAYVSNQQAIMMRLNAAVK